MEAPVVILAIIHSIYYTYTVFLSRFSIACAGIFARTLCSNAGSLYWFHRVPLQFVKRRKGFLFRQTGIDGFDHLVIIHANSPILALQIGQFHIVVHRPFVDPDHLERTIENGREDELRFGLGAR